MDKAPTGSEAHDSLNCGAQSLSCFSYVDPTNVERAGLKLFCQACICPAAVLAANASLLEGEDTATQAHSIPCSNGFAIGPRGLEAYQTTCRSQLVCGLLCMGLPVVFTENLCQRQRIRDKYGMPQPSSGSEICAGCCYPCSLFQSHTFLYIRQHHKAVEQQPQGDKAPPGPMMSALRARRVAATSARSQDVAAAVQQDTRGAALPSDTPGGGARASLRESFKSPVKGPSDAGRQSETTPVKRQQEAASPSATPPARICALPAASSVGETPEGPVVTLFGKGAHAANTRRHTPCGPSASASSAESRSTPASGSIPPPEVTDSPPMGAPAPAESYSASSASHPEEESALADSASFPPPSALPLGAMVREPPTFAVPRAFRPPDSTDSEVMAAWMQGPKLTHLSQVPQPAGEGVRHHPSEQPSMVGQVPRPAPPPPPAPALPAASSAMTCSDASLFSLALDPSASHASPLQAPMGMPGCRPSAAATMTTTSIVAATAAVPEGPLPTPGGSRDMQHGAYDTITSSKLSSMIDHAMLNGSGASAPRGGIVSTSVDPSLPWDSYRHSVMAPIAEAEVEDGSMSNNRIQMQVQGGPGQQDDALAGLASCVREPGSGGASPSHRAGSSNSRNVLRNQRAGGFSGNGSSRGTLIGSGGRLSGGSGASGTNGAAAGVAGGVGGAALTALARMGSDCGGTAVSGARAGGNNRSNHAGAFSQRRTPAPTLSSGAATNVPAAAAHVAGPVRDGPRGTRLCASVGDDGVGASADNFSTQQYDDCLGPGPSLHPQPASTAPSRDGPPRPAPMAYPPPSAFEDGDDAVNLASIRPSFIDAPELEGFKEVLRKAGEQADAMAALPPAASPGPTTTAVSCASAASGAGAGAGSQRVMSLAPTVTSLPQRGGGQGRYGGHAAQPMAAVQAGGGGMALQYASYCADGHSHDETGCGSVEDDASSAIDGPVSSGEAESAAMCGRVVRPAGVAAAAAATAARHCPEDSDPATSLAAGREGEGDGDVSVSIAAPSKGGSGGASPPGGADEPAVSESTAAGLVGARRSVSGLSGGESNAAYDSVNESVSMSQHRQKHWVNWMAQSVGASVGASVVCPPARNMRGTAGKHSAGAAPGMGLGAGRGSRMMVMGTAEPSASCVSVNQRAPYTVAEESDDVLYERWA